MTADKISLISQWIIPLFLLIVFLTGWLRRLPIYEYFVEGAQEGFALAIRLIPYIVGIYVAIGIFRSSGAMELSVMLLAPLLSIFNIPGEVLPLMLVRPFSGPAALGLTAELMDRFGPDSFIGRLACTLEGSTDTTFYILAVYFASVGIRRTAYAVPVGLLADFAGFAGAIFICYKIFS
ncbi:MAG: spore maturation protein [Syntrophomonadaceae bacterium]|jgi:spore maturation protein B|nr:spore maturation protein [Syntrophomonadaceae bacterium]